MKAEQYIKELNQRDYDKAKRDILRIINNRHLQAQDDFSGVVKDENGKTIVRVMNEREIRRAYMRVEKFRLKEQEKQKMVSGTIEPKPLLQILNKQQNIIK